MEAIVNIGVSWEVLGRI